MQAMIHRRPERWVVGVLVLLLHLAGLWVWPPIAPGPRVFPPTPFPVPVAVRVLPPVTTTSMPPRTASPPPPPVRNAGAPVHAPTVALQEATPAPAVDPSASAPSPLDLRLHLPRGAVAERGGLTEATDSMRRAALNDPRGNVRSDPTQVLPNAVASSAKGDCVKGDYLGAGMGVLSLPLLAVAVIRDACKPAR